MDLSFPPGNSVSDRIPKNSYLGKKAVCATLRWMRWLNWSGSRAGAALSWKVISNGLISRYLLTQGTGISWEWDGEMVYFDMTMPPMGLCSSAMSCQRITNAVKFIMRSKGFDLVAYLDDMVSSCRSWAQVSESMHEDDISQCSVWHGEAHSRGVRGASAGMHDAIGWMVG